MSAMPISYENQVNDMNKKQSMFAKEYAWRGLMTAGGLLVIVITICIGAFLVYKGSGTFTIFHHSLSDFLFSADWGSGRQCRRWLVRSEH